MCSNLLPVDSSLLPMYRLCAKLRSPCTVANCLWATACCRCAVASCARLHMHSKQRHTDPGQGHWARHCLPAEADREREDEKSHLASEIIVVTRLMQTEQLPKKNHTFGKGRLRQPKVRRGEVRSPGRSADSDITLQRFLWLAGSGHPSREMGEEGGEASGDPTIVFQKWPDQIFPMVNFIFSRGGHFGLEGGGGGLAQGLGITLFAFGGAYWPLATAQSDPLWARTCFGCVTGAPG